MAESVARAPKGFEDVLAGAAPAWERLEQAFFALAVRWGYPRVRLPVVEYTRLFARSVGASSDIVRKEMFTFTDRGDRSLTLRPEGTAGAVRAFVEHHLDQGGLPWKASYTGQMYRAENVQRGRQREFNQVGVEAIGVEDPDLDVEVLALGWRFLQDLAVPDVRLLLNTIGTLEERAPFLEALRAWALAAVPGMGDDDRTRLELNPLRILDSKDPAMVAALAAGDVPRLVDHLGAASVAHFAAVRAGLDDLGVPYVVDDRLVRGLDYYTATTFEFVAGGLDAAQNTVLAGGRYDGLVAELGGPALPAIGFAAGVERLLLAIGAGPADPAIDVVVLRVGATQAVVRRLLTDLREAGVSADTPYGDRSLKAQMKHADRLGASLVVIAGATDLATGVVTLRDLRSGEEERIAMDIVVGEVRRRC